jgi:lysine 6-dehydrogenase
MIISLTIVYNLIMYEPPKERKRMRVVVVGGAGAMGAVAVTELAAYPEITELVIADRNERAAHEVADRARQRAHTGLRVEPVRLDLDQPEDLKLLLDGAHVCVNTAGPFYRYGTVVLQAAIEAGTNYADICDDWEPTEEMLSLTDQARAAGVTAIVGMGASPGALNLLAALATARLDTVDQLHVAWPIDVPVGENAEADPDESLVDAHGEPSAAAVHWMQQISGTIRVFKDGRFEDLEPLQPVTLDYPGFGTGTAYTVGHPEPITLPTSLGVRTACSCLMIVKPTTIAMLDMMRRAIDGGELDNRSAALALDRPGARRTVAAIAGSATRRGPGHLPGFFAFASGMRRGSMMQVGATVRSFPPGMAAATGIPLAIAVRQLITEEQLVRGVLPPEAVVKPEPFFAELAAHCQPSVAPDDLVHVTEHAG